MCWEGESSTQITSICRVRLKSQVGRMMNVILNGSLHVLGGGEFHANNLNLQGKIEISCRMKRIYYHLVGERRAFNLSIQDLQSMFMLANLWM